MSKQSLRPLYLALTRVYTQSYTYGAPQNNNLKNHHSFTFANNKEAASSTVTDHTSKTNLNQKGHRHLPPHQTLRNPPGRGPTAIRNDRLPLM